MRNYKWAISIPEIKTTNEILIPEFDIVEDFFFFHLSLAKDKTDFGFKVSYSFQAMLKTKTPLSYSQNIITVIPNKGEKPAVTLLLGIGMDAAEKIYSLFEDSEVFKRLMLPHNEIAFNKKYKDSVVKLWRDFV